MDPTGSKQYSTKEGIERNEDVHAEPELTTEIKHEIFDQDALESTSVADSEWHLNIGLNETLVKQEFEEGYMEKLSSGKCEQGNIKTEEIQLKCDEENSILNEFNQEEGTGDKSGKYNKTGLNGNYKCSQCSYQTPYKTMFSSHLINRHKKSAQAATLTCSECPYTTNEKRNLVKHFRRHQKRQNTKDLQTGAGMKRGMPQLNSTIGVTKNLQCSECSYRTDQINNLRRHVLRYHETVRDSDVHRCSQCSYRALCSSNLKKHIRLQHSSISEDEILKCAVCPYETHIRESLVKHVRRHNTIFTCTECDYKTNDKSTISRHVIVRHRKPEEVTMYQCTECPYQTRNKFYIKYHKLRHRTSEEFDGFVCYDCGLWTRYKRTLKRHILLNKLDKTVTNKCRLCDFQTRHKCVLTKHKRMCHKKTDGSKVM